MQAYPPNQWIFFFFSRDPINNEMFLYSSDSSLSLESSFKETNTGQQYDLSANSIIYVGGSPSLGGTSYNTYGCNCTMSMLRFYRNLYINDKSLIPRFFGYGLGTYDFLFMTLLVMFITFALDKAWYFDFSLDKASPQNFIIDSNSIDLTSYTSSKSSSVQGTLGLYSTK